MYYIGVYMRVLAFLRVIPIGTGSASISRYVAEAVKVIEASGLKYQVTPFGTAVEAESIREVFELAERIINALRSLGTPRILVDVSFDLRYDKEISLDYKVKTVVEKIERGSRNVKSL